MTAVSTQQTAIALGVGLLLWVGCPGPGDDVGGSTPTGVDTDLTGGATTGSTGVGSGSEASSSSDEVGSATGSDTTTPAGTDTGPADDTTTTAGNGEPGQYLLTVDNGASPPALVRIDLAAGQSEVVCELPSNAAYGSLVFSREGILFANNETQGRLDTINPCNCGFQLVGPTSAGALVLTLTARDELYAIDLGLDALSRVDTGTGLANIIGPLGLDFAGTGAAWSDALTGVYAVEGGTDQLYAIDARAGLATATVGLSLDVTSPGLAVHPDGTFWMCSGSTLYELDPLTGIATEHGALDLAAGCTGLAAPQTAISCFD